MYHPLLTTFIEAADCGSFSRAAKKLYISPTAVMKQMNQLESLLGLILIERTSHGIRLTEAGNAIYKDARFMISYSENAVEKARKLRCAKDYVLRVGTSLLNPCKVFMDLWTQISDKVPRYKIQIVPFEDRHENILSVIGKLGQTLDFIVGACDSSLWLNRCNYLPIGEYQKCVAVPAGHPLASKKCLKADDLHGETLMMVSRGDSAHNDELRDFLEAEHPQIHLEDAGYFYDIDVYNRCEQQGYLLLNLECWKDVHPSLVTLPVEWGFTLPYGLLYPMHPDQRILEFLEVLKGSLPQESEV